MTKFIIIISLISPIFLIGQTAQDKAKAKELGLSEYQMMELVRYANEKNYIDSENNSIDQRVINNSDKKTPKKILKNEPVISKTEKLKDSNLKDSIKIDSVKKVFGYDIFANATTIKNFNVETNFFAGDDYILGVGDRIGISIYGASNHSSTHVIGMTGALQIKRVGRIYLNGITLGKAKEIIKKRLSAVINFNNSSAEINLMYARDLFVNIVGEVKVQGSFKIKGYHSVFNSLYLSEGIKEGGTLRDIKVKRNGKVVHTLDVYRYITDSTYINRFSLENNDFIMVGQAKKVVFLDGMVKKSLRYELKSNEGLKALLNYSGGFNHMAYRKSIKIIRVNDAGEEIIDVNWDELESNGEDFILKDGDKIFVRKVSDYIENLVKIEGAINIPGEYEYYDSMTVKDLIENSEGLRNDAYKERFYLIRTLDNFEKYYESLNGTDIINNKESLYNLKLQPNDVLKIFSRKDFVESDSVTIWGEVRKPDKFEYGKGMNIKDLLYLAGGLNREAAISRIEISRIIDFDQKLNVFRPIRSTVKTIELDYNLEVSELDALFELKPNDQVYVRQEPGFIEQQNVTLAGEFNYPGTYSLFAENDRLYDLLQRAGGLSEFAFAEGAKLFRSEADMGYLFIELKKLVNNPNSVYNYVLKPGDTIFVPKVNDLVSICGAIEYPDIDSILQINAPYIKRKRAKYYVKKFGVDFDDQKRAKRGKTTVTLPNGIVTKTKNYGLFKIYPKVYKGSKVTVNVKKKKEDIKEKIEQVPVDWNRLFENLTVKVSGVLTLYFLISRI